VAKSPDAFRTISEAADELDVPQHVLRFWETKFGHIRPLKRAGGRRYYRPADLDLLRGVRNLLYEEGYTIKGVQKIFREHGPRKVSECGRGASLGAVGETAPPAAANGAAAPVEGATVGQASNGAAQPSNGAAVERSAAVVPLDPRAAAPRGLDEKTRAKLQAMLDQLESVKASLDEALAGRDIPPAPSPERAERAAKI